MRVSKHGLVSTILIKIKNANVKAGDQLLHFSMEQLGRQLLEELCIRPIAIANL